MKRLIYILSLFISIFSSAQAPLGADSANPVMDYVYQNIGKRVGDGICVELVVQAMSKKYPDWEKSCYDNDSVMNAHLIDEREMREGDIIVMQKVLFSDSSYCQAHTGIVIKSDGDIICYAEQNSGSGKMRKVKYKGVYIDTYKNSVVKFAYLDRKKILSGDLYIFRF